MRTTADESTPRTNQKLGYLPALDGLRGLAVIAVMLYHFESKALLPGGGIIGVDLFMVLSGFLITTLLLQEWNQFNDISLKQFYLRRGLRLLPAVATFLLVYVCISVGLRGYDFAGNQPTELVLRNAMLVGLYCFNWIFVIGGDHGQGFGHLWTLSVEEQFYLFWPFLLLLLLRLRRPALLLTITVGVVAVSASLPFIIEGERSRFYYATDFRLHTLLIGAVLAQLFVSGALNQTIVRWHSFQATLYLAAAVLIAAGHFVINRSTFLFLGGHTLTAICAAVMITGCMFPQRTTWSGVLSHPVLVYVGKRSYALYLWHYAIGFWLRSFDAVPQVILAFLLSFVAAELSYRLVESRALQLKSRLGKPSSQKVPPPGILVPESASTAA